MYVLEKAVRSANGDQEMSIEVAVVGIVNRVDISQEMTRSSELISEAKKLRGEK